MKVEELNLYELISSMYGIDAKGGPKRFSTPGWFYTGQVDDNCPNCGNKLETFRKPYTTTTGEDYLFWAALCLTCKICEHPKSLGVTTAKLKKSFDRIQEIVMPKPEYPSLNYIYILKLEQESWYVGTTKNLQERLITHASKSPYSFINMNSDKTEYNSKGCTGKRKATHLHAVFYIECDDLKLTEIENTITASMANKYGYEKVRGGVWFQPWNISPTNKQALEFKAKFTRPSIREYYNLTEIDPTTIVESLPLPLSHTFNPLNENK